MTPFRTATAFRKSLEARLQNRAKMGGEDLQRLRRKVAFDRFLARIFASKHSPFYLKGGYAMEIRFANARTTKDVDLTYACQPDPLDLSIHDHIFDALRKSCQLDLEDYFFYQIGTLIKDLVNCPYGGARFPIRALVDGRLFVRFNLDVGVGTTSGVTEYRNGTDWLNFCEIPAPKFSMISLEQQLAEKFHAYLVPRGERENTRVKDLVDMLLLVNGRQLERGTLRRALKRVFGPTPLPTTFPTPPESWHSIYKAMATECGITETLTGAFDLMRRRWSEIVELLEA